MPKVIRFPAGRQNVCRSGDDFLDLLAALSHVFCVRLSQQKHCKQNLRARLVLDVLLVGHVQLDGEPDNLLLDESQVSAINRLNSRVKHILNYNNKKFKKKNRFRVYFKFIVCYCGGLRKSANGSLTGSVDLNLIRMNGESQFCLTRTKSGKTSIFF